MVAYSGSLPLHLPCVRGYILVRGSATGMYMYVDVHQAGRECEERESDLSTKCVVALYIYIHCAL